MKNYLTIIILSLIIFTLITGVFIFWHIEKKSTDELLKTTKEFIEKKDFDYKKALDAAGVKVITTETIKYIPKAQEDNLLLTADEQRSEFKFKFEDTSTKLAKATKKIDLSPWVYCGFDFDKITNKFGVDALVGTDLSFWIYNNPFIPDNTFSFDIGAAVKLYQNIGAGLKLGFTVKIK